MLGAEVNGVWEKYTDTTDVNASDTNFQHGVIVTGDDFGLVKLFRFPCIKKGMTHNTDFLIVVIFHIFFRNLFKNA